MENFCEDSIQQCVDSVTSKLSSLSLTELDSDMMLKVLREMGLQRFQQDKATAIRRDMIVFLSKVGVSTVSEITDEHATELAKIAYKYYQKGKARGGKSCELYVEYILQRGGIRNIYTQRCRCRICSSSKKPLKGDIIITDKDNQHILLTIKTTLKERWKQMLTEHEKDTSSTSSTSMTPSEFLRVFALTIDNISEEILKSFVSHNITIIVPSYVEQRPQPALTLTRFVDTIRCHQRYNVIDLFCGAGGLSTGFLSTGFYNIIYGIDCDLTCCKTYATNIWHPYGRQYGACGVTCADIRAITSDVVADYTKQIIPAIGTTGNIDLIIGSPPCQGFSMAGSRDPKDPRNSLFMEFVKFVGVLHPKFFVMENVAGILSAKTASEEAVINIIVSEFAKIGYTVKYALLLTCDYGVPQKRKRVIFIGNKFGINVEFPLPTHTSEQYVPVKTCLLPREQVPQSYFHSQKMIDGFITRKERNLTSHKGFGAQYLDLDKPSFTISARYWKDGADALVKYSDTEIRMLTELEVARIQTFPDSYKFAGSKKEIYMQIGNAVPPLFAKAIALHIENYLRYCRDVYLS